MPDKLELNDLQKLLTSLNVEEFEGVEIEGDLEIEIEPGAGGGMNPMLAYMIGQETTQAAVHLMNIARVMGFPVEQMFQQQQAAVPEMPEPAVKKLDQLVRGEFEVSTKDWPNQIEEVVLGATSSDGGTRGHTITLGGEEAQPYYSFDSKLPNRNYVTIDIFDMPITLASAVKEHYEDVMEDPAEWAKKAVDEFDADMVTVHLISTDPSIKDTPASEAVKVLEDVMQAVDVPLVIGGSGNPDKDPEVLEKAAEVAEGERCLLASANLNMDFERIAKAANDYGHAILSWTQLDINAQKELNRKLLKNCEIERSDLVMDPTTAALGYGLDYAYTNMERIRIAGLRGDNELAFPISSGTTNAWGAREAWMKESPMVEDSDWGPREYRGPIWEIVTALTLSLAGSDLFMMMHPGSVQFMKQATQTLFGAIDADPVDISDWITREV